MSGSDSPASKDRFAKRLAAHPRIVGALVTLLVLLSKAGAVAANGGNVTNGP